MQSGRRWTTAQTEQKKTGSGSPGPSPVPLRAAGPHVLASSEEWCYVRQAEMRNLGGKWKVVSGGFANLEWAGQFGSLEGVAGVVAGAGAGAVRC